VIPVALTDFRNDQLMELSRFFKSRGSHIKGMGAVRNYRVSPFVAGFAVVKSKKNSKLGVINEDFEMVIPVEHNKIMIDDSGAIHVW
jgi:hypothetical protein